MDGIIWCTKPWTDSTTTDLVQPTPVNFKPLMSYTMAECVVWTRPRFWPDQCLCSTQQSTHYIHRVHILRSEVNTRQVILKGAFSHTQLWPGHLSDLGCRKFHSLNDWNLTLRSLSTLWSLTDFKKHCLKRTSAFMHLYHWYPQPPLETPVPSQDADWPSFLHPISAHLHAPSFCSYARFYN